MSSRRSLTGKIESVAVVNFITYDACVFTPTEYLNVVIGPNGSGKSTIVAAIIIGLGGNPKILSRAQDLESYIKNNKTEAVIKVNIYTTCGNVTTFQHKFNRDGQSQFKIDGKTLSRIKFLDVVTDFKIQVANLCQFLPQDRVQDFAKMNRQELFHNTVISVCSEDIINKFTQLKELQTLRAANKSDSEANRKKLSELMTRIDELKQSLKMYQARETYTEQLNVCRAKIAWMALDDIKAKIREFENDLKTANKSMSEHKRAYDRIIKTQANFETNIDRYKQSVEKEKSKLNGLTQKKNKIVEDIDKFHKDIRDSKLKMQKEKRELNEREAEMERETALIKLTGHDIEEAKTQVQADRDAKVIEHCDRDINDMRTKERTLQATRAQLCDSLDEITPEVEMLRNRIAHMENIKEQRLQILTKRFPDVYGMVKWLREHAHEPNMFRGKIYEPMILELTLPDQSEAKYLENTVPLRDLIAFTCEDKSDCSKLQTIAIKQNLKINIIHSAPASECAYTPSEPIDNYKQFGFTSYLLNLVEGPPTILNYLCSLYNLHKIPIGSNMVDRHTDRIKHPLFYGGDQRYVLSISKYSNHSSLMQSVINSKKLFSNVTEHDLEKLNRRLQELIRKSDGIKNERTAVEAKINAIQHSLRELVKKKGTVQETINRFNQLKDKMRRQQEKIERLRCNTTTIEDLESAFKATVARCLKRIVALQNNKIATLIAIKDVMIKVKYIEYECVAYNLENQTLRAEITTISEQKKNAQNLVNTITVAVEKTKLKYKQCLANANELTDNTNPNSAQYQHREFYDSLPDAKDEINETINELNARLDCIGDVSREVATEYRTKTQEVDMLVATIAQGTDEDAVKMSEIEDIYNSWYPTIESVINSLNTKFSDFMTSMTFVGEVLLRRKSEFEFDSYGIDIMVQYRHNVPLKALDRNVQSGGERAVAIAVYTLSMQHLTHVPFRCVDEVNQGMDPQNERIVFNMLVTETTKVGSSQYFFITPKLLHGLMPHKRLTYHTVFGNVGQLANFAKPGRIS